MSGQINVSPALAKTNVGSEAKDQEKRTSLLLPCPLCRLTSLCCTSSIHPALCAEPASFSWCSATCWSYKDEKNKAQALKENATSVLREDPEERWDEKGTDTSQMWNIGLAGFLGKKESKRTMESEVTCDWTKVNCPSLKRSRNEEV